MVGFAGLVGDGHLDTFYCRKDSVGRGVGSRLYRAVEQEALTLECDQIFTKASITARPFFERHGFRIIRERTDGRAPGRRVDELRHGEAPALKIACSRAERTLPFSRDDSKIASGSSDALERVSKPVERPSRWIHRAGNFASLQANGASPLRCQLPAKRF